MSPQTICFVTREYPPETGYGGIGSYYADLARLLTSRGFRVVILSEALTEESFLDNEGIHIYRVRPRWDVNRLPFFWRLNRYWTGYRLAVATKLRQIVRQYAVDIIETPEMFAQTFLYHLLNLSQPPLVVRLHSGTAFGIYYNKQPRIPRFRINLVLENWLLRHATLVTAPSHALVVRSRELGLPVPLHQTHVVPNPVNTDLFFPDSATPRDQATVLFVARIEWWKGPDILIEILPQVVAAVPQAVFRFVGINPDTIRKNEFQEILMNDVPEDLRKHVEFLPWGSRSCLPEMYRRATIVVVPSRWESFGYVCAEAMACGTPVIVHNRGGLPEIVGDQGAGIIVEPEQPAELATAIIDLLRNPARREALSELERRRIIDYCDSQHVVDELVQFYEGLAVRQTRKPRTQTHTG